MNGRHSYWYSATYERRTNHGFYPGKHRADRRVLVVLRGDASDLRRQMLRAARDVSRLGQRIEKGGA